MRYQIEYNRNAARELRKLSHSDRATAQRIVEAIGTLACTPRPQGSKKLTDRRGYRIRVGTYRVIYEVNDNTVTVTVIRIASRGSAYS